MYMATRKCFITKRRYSSGKLAGSVYTGDLTRNYTDARSTRTHGKQNTFKRIGFHCIRNGRGTMKYGARYNLGKSRHKNKNFKKYTGQWVNSKMSGEGTMIYTNGDKYTGKWKNSKRHGKGKMKTNNPKGKISGIWNNDTLLNDEYISSINNKLSEFGITVSDKKFKILLNDSWEKVTANMDVDAIMNVVANTYIDQQSVRKPNTTASPDERYNSPFARPSASPFDRPSASLPDSIFANSSRFRIDFGNYILDHPKVSETPNDWTKTTNKTVPLVEYFENAYKHPTATIRVFMLEHFKTEDWTLFIARGDGPCSIRAAMSNVICKHGIEPGINFSKFAVGFDDDTINWANAIEFLFYGLNHYFDNGRIQNRSKFQTWSEDIHGEGNHRLKPFIMANTIKNTDVVISRNDNKTFNFEEYYTREDTAPYLVNLQNITAAELKREWIEMLTASVLDNTIFDLLARSLGMNILILAHTDKFKAYYFGKNGENDYVDTDQVDESNSMIISRMGGAHYNFIDCLDRKKLKQKIIEFGREYFPNSTIEADQTMMVSLTGTFPELDETLIKNVLITTNNDINLAATQLLT